MSQAAIEKETCNACGADIRLQAEYCYNCGTAVSPAAAEKVSLTSDDESQTVNNFGEKIAVEKKPVREESAAPESERETDEKIIDRKTAAEIIPKEAETVDEEKAEAGASEGERQTSVTEPTNLKSAAALRRRPKSSERKTVEVVWEEHDNAPNGWFISVAVFLTLIAVGVLFLAMYLK